LSLFITEKLRRNNQVIEEALNERLKLVADILKVPLSNSSPNTNNDQLDGPNAILLSAVSQGKTTNLFNVQYFLITYFIHISGNEIITVLNESLNMTDVDTIATSLGASSCSLYKSYATQLSRITKVRPIVASLNSQITELLVRNYLKNNSKTGVPLPMPYIVFHRHNIYEICVFNFYILQIKQRLCEIFLIYII